MFYILVRPYYYSTTLNPMVSHKMYCPWTNEPLLFDTVEDAKKHLKSEGITTQLSAQKFILAGDYHLSHGEYSRPDYWIRKCRKTTNN